MLHQPSTQLQLKAITHLHLVSPQLGVGQEETISVGQPPGDLEAVRAVIKPQLQAHLVKVAPAEVVMELEHGATWLVAVAVLVQLVEMPQPLRQEPAESDCYRQYLATLFTMEAVGAEVFIVVDLQQQVMVD
ncbi:hypothetical protein PHIN9_13240 [Polynucleobacter sp. HIN9]|nr:hypothetical protein PHIN9_13240 [Polynucleobacter sp. HIN9]